VSERKSLVTSVTYFTCVTCVTFVTGAFGEARRMLGSKVCLAA
jgi:hypothetical protein